MDPLLQTAIRYAVAAFLTWLATKTGIAAFNSPDFVNVAVAAASAAGVAGVAALGIVASTITAKAKDVAAVPGTTIVTSPAIAASTPAQANIVSNTDVKVVPASALNLNPTK